MCHPYNLSGLVLEIEVDLFLDTSNHFHNSMSRNLKDPISAILEKMKERKTISTRERFGGRFTNLGTGCYAKLIFNSGIFDFFFQFGIFERDGQKFSAQSANMHFKPIVLAKCSKSFNRNLFELEFNLVV